MAIGNNGVIKTSSDGKNWTTQTSNTFEKLNGIAYGSTTFAVVGENGTVLSSPDGINWTSRTSGTTNTLNGITYGNIYFKAVGINGTILTSLDGVTWTDHSANISQTLYGAAYGNGMYVLVGAGGMVLSSPDGTNWTQRSSGTSQILRGVAYGDNQFVAVGGNGVILTGSNGINWTSRVSSINVDLLDAAYGNGVYAAVGNSGKILTSMDLVTWTSRSSGVRNDLSGVIYGNLRFVAVGVSEIIYSMCEQAAAADAVNNQKFLQGPGAVFSKRAPGRRRQEKEDYIDVKAFLNLVSPNGDETLQAGEKFLITWESEPNVEKVKLEYSPDNGTSYLPIAVDVVNIGNYEWLVPHHVSSHCLVRISEKKERKMPPHGLVYEMDFSVNGVEFSGSGDSFTIYLGDATDESIKNNLSLVSFSHESNGKVYIHLDDSIKEIGRVTGFNDKWHHVQIFMDNVYDRISVILDGKLVFESIPRSPTTYFSPALSFCVGAGHAVEVEIDDVSVSAFYLLEGKQQWAALFREDFGQLNEKNDLGSRGWRTKGEQFVKSNQEESGLKHLSIKPVEGYQVTVVKTFNVPVDFPFDVSDKTFKIRYNDDMYSESAAFDVYPGHGSSGVSSNNFYLSTTKTLNNRTQRISRTSELFNTYYIYTFDGKLLAEYDHNGNCIRDYVYFGNLLLADYKPQTNEFFYYMPDQISSTRIILNENREVVFSEAYGPYGDVQKTWINTYDPKLKFSGKEREGYSDLDYFGARYYNHKSYRFNSVDPVINKKEAFYNPQLWNLYAYCNNNPITYFDPEGRISESMGKYEYTVAEHFGKASNDPVSKMFLLSAVAFNVGYFAGPEIMSAVGAAGASAIPAIKKVGDKIGNFFSRLFSIFNARTKQAIEYIINNPNKMEHIFDAKHNLNIIVQQFGSKENVIRAAVNSLGKLPNGVFEVIRNIGGANVTIRGIVIDKVPKIGTMFIRQ